MAWCLVNSSTSRVRRLLTRYGICYKGYGNCSSPKERAECVETHDADLEWELIGTAANGVRQYRRNDLDTTYFGQRADLKQIIIVTFVSLETAI